MASGTHSIFENDTLVKSEEPQAVIQDQSFKQLGEQPSGDMALSSEHVGSHKIN